MKIVQKKSAAVWWLRNACICLCVIGLLAFGLTGCGEKADPQQDAEVSQTEEDLQDEIQDEAGEQGEDAVSADGFVIETSVCDICIPAEYEESLRHVETVQDGNVMEVFYANHDDVDLEAFRILFSTDETEKDIGVMKTENGDYYVSVTVSEYYEEEFADDVIKEKYYAAMSALNAVLESVQMNENFAEKKDVEIENVNNQFQYWEVTLPANMEWEESDENGYFVTFYGNVNGEKVKLYAVSMGETALVNQIGYYNMDDGWVTVTMESYELPSTDGWAESAETELYTMMSSINAVLDSIMASENFAEEISE